jgi:hypothetical protein
MNWKNLTIKKGRHRSTFSWKPFFSSGKIFLFSFNDSSKYVLPEPHQLAINKLVGFTDGCINHHKNSFRIGWRYLIDTNQVEVLSYTYVDGEMSFKLLSTVDLYTNISVAVSCEEDHYRVLVENYKVHYIPRSKKIKWKYKHMLYPYFGGQKVAQNFIYFLVHWKGLPKPKKSHP